MRKKKTDIEVVTSKEISTKCATEVIPTVVDNSILDNKASLVYQRYLQYEEAMKKLGCRK